MLPSLASLLVFVQLWELMVEVAEPEPLVQLAQKALLEQPEKLVRLAFRELLGQLEQLEHKASSAALEQLAQEQRGPLEPKELPAFKAPLGPQAVQQMRHNCKG
jgi:hypothetical protein